MAGVGSGYARARWEQGGASAADDEEMEDHEEMEEDSNTNMQMLAARGTLIAGMADGTVTQTRDSAKHCERV